MVSLERPQPELGTEGDVVFKRIAAFLIDAVLFGVVFGVFTNIVATISETLGLLVGGLATVLFFAYFIYFEAEYGQTVGKMLMDIMVVTEDGNPIDYRESAIRTVLRIVDALPFFYLVGLAAIYFTDRNQRLGDLLADTIVVETKEKVDKL
ncbi:RDD family protein [Natronomonas halophila]|uniref:RDD family protein n=1 Tax=Natronomonas halophila TaxID=2747817 RepID=UPI0015B3B29E|nr:RDD family protein [Natronomonas halophila]QLD84904.1 RDD family protein [Natronomonas halophila]